MQKKLRLGWFSFTCCEDSTIIFTELLNQHYRQWKNQLEFVHAKVLQNNNRWEEMDVAFVEGAVTSPQQENKLKKIRSLAKYVVAIGACACIGMPAGQRNQFDDQTRQEIQAVFTRFQYFPTVKRLNEIIQIDDQVPGCPMNETIFINVLNRYLKEFEIVT